MCSATASETTVPYEEQIERKRCDSPCSGNRNETCGGGSEVEWFWLKSACNKGISAVYRSVFEWIERLLLKR